MKRLISLLCALCLLFSLSVAEAYEATNLQKPRQYPADDTAKHHKTGA